MSNPNLANIYKTLAAKVEGGIALQQVLPLGDGAFKIIAHASKRNMQEADFGAAIAREMDNRVHLVEGSLSQRDMCAVAVVKANAVSRLFDKAEFAHVTAETASDSGGNLWSVRVVDGKKYVVQESSDDLEALFSARCAAKKTTLSPIETRSVAAVAAFKNCDYVKYVDTASGKTVGGLAFNVGGQLTIVDSKCVTHPVNANAVLASVPRQHLPGDLPKAIEPFEENAALSPDKMATILAYLRKAYAADAANDMLEKMARIAGVPLSAASVPTF